MFRRGARRSLTAGGLAVGLAVLGSASGDPGRVPAPALELIRWRAPTTGTARALAQSLPEPAAPTGVVDNRRVTVSWAATTMSGGAPVPGYVVRRFDQNGALQTILSNCAGTVTTTSCTENNVPSGQWRYSVQAVVGSAWAGPQSARSATVTVAAATLVFTGSTTIASLPATLPDTVANFLPLESLTYHLDSAAGPTVSGTPTSASATGSGSGSVTIPGGTSDAPHSVFVVGGLGSVAAAAADIVIPPVLNSRTMRDTNANGKVDQVVAAFDDTLAPYSAGIAPWTLANVPSGGTLQSVATSGATATLTIAEGPGVASTAAGGFTIALAANSAGIRDVYDHPTSFAATAVTDGAAPAVTSLVTQDTNANGKVDRAVATLSETLAAYSAGSTPWTLANIPSAGAFSGVTVSGTTATLTITEGAGAVDTTVGSFTVALASSPTGIRDSAGNLTSFAARAPADGVAPVRTGLDVFDGDHNGRVDRVVATFSETLAAYSAPVTVWALANAPSGATVNSVSVNGSAATLTLNEGTGAATTAVGSFTVALAASATGVRDGAGNPASFAAAAPADKAPPALVALTLLDNNTNGKVDRVTATFSEALLSNTATTPWTLANVPSGGSLASLAVSSPTVTLTLNEGSGAVDTAVGTMSVALAASATGVRDSAGNLTSFAATTPADGAKPVTVTITDTNGTTDGKIQAGDTLVVTFSEPLYPTTVPASSTVTLTDPNGGGNDTLAVTGITNGAVATGSNGYVGNDNTSAAFAGSTVALSNGNRTVTVTVGPTCSGTGCASLAAVTSSPSLSFIAATTLTDAVGNAAVGTKSQAINLF